MALNWIIFLVFTLLFSCGKKKIPPSFAVRPLSNSSVRSLPMTANTAFSAALSCTTEVEYYNDSNSELGEWGPGSAPQMNFELGRPYDSRDYLSRSYATGIFYDCEVRRQAIQDSRGELRSSSSIQSVLNTREDRGVPVRDWTFFVAWEGDFDASENRGRLVNLHLQSDNTRTKTRIDMNKQNGLKTMDMFLYYQFNNGMDLFSRAYFREISETEHYLAKRYFDTIDNRVIVTVGHYLEGVGSSSFLNNCDTAIFNYNFNITCPLGSSPTELYLDEDGNPLSAAQAANAGLITLSNISTLTDGIANLDRFYTGTIDEFFTPVFE